MPVPDPDTFNDLTLRTCLIHPDPLYLLGVSDSSSSAAMDGPTWILYSFVLSKTVNAQIPPLFQWKILPRFRLTNCHVLVSGFLPVRNILTSTTLLHRIQIQKRFIIPLHYPVSPRRKRVPFLRLAPLKVPSSCRFSATESSLWIAH